MSAKASEFFDRFALTFDTLYDGQRNALMRWVDRQFRSDMFVRFARTFELMGDLAGRSVLDIGCGSGPYIVEALRRGALRVTGVDPAGSMLVLARKRVDDGGFCARIELIQSEFPTANLAEHDFAIVMGVMDYIDDPRAFMTALRPLVKIGASVSFPCRHWFRSRFRRLRYWLRGCPLFFYDVEAIQEICSGAGFRQVLVQKIPGAGMDFHVYVSS